MIRTRSGASSPETLGGLLTGSHVRRSARQLRRSRADEELEPILIGFGSLDADLRGISAGQVLGVAARTAVGKTWILASVLNNLAAHRGLGTLVLSLEMPAEEWAERQVAIATGLRPSKWEAAAREERLGEILGDSLDRLEHAVIVEDPLALHESPAPSATRAPGSRCPCGS